MNEIDPCINQVSFPNSTERPFILSSLLFQLVVQEIFQNYMLFRIVEEHIEILNNLSYYYKCVYIGLDEIYV